MQTPIDDPLTIKLNDLAKENFKRLEDEQSTEEGLMERQQRRNEWTRENLLYIGKLEEAQRREAAKYEYKRYKG